jgi:hypothetical protein
MSEAWWYAGLITGQVIVHLIGPYFGYPAKSLPLVIVGLVIGFGLATVFDKVANSSGGPSDGPGAPA